MYGILEVPTFRERSTHLAAARPPSLDPYYHLHILPQAESLLSDTMIFGGCSKTIPARHAKKSRKTRNLL